MTHAELAQPRPVHARRARAAFAALVAALSLGLTSCDNPACVFGGTCSGDDVIVGANPPTTPANHAWLRDGAPSISAAFPNGTNATLESPLVLVFSESMAAATLGQGAFELVSDDSPAPLPVVASALVGDGRMWVGAPGLALAASTEYSLRVAANRTLTDLQGAALSLPTDRVVATFTTAASSPATPRVLTSFPADGASGQSATGELVVVFDRPMNPLTVNLASFRVRVNGAAPSFNPSPSALQFGSAPDTRVWRYRSVDSSGEAAPFPNSAAVELELSPTGATIQAAGSGAAALPRTLIEYTAAAFAAPRAAFLTSLPADAIGIENLDGVNPLQLSLDLSGAQLGDTLRIFVFGRTREEEPREALLSRSVTLNSTLLDVQLQIATIGEAQLDLASSSSPLAARLLEEQIDIAFALQRGSVSSPVRLLDVDPDTAGAQGPLLDVTRPTLTGLGGTGQVTSAFVTDRRDFAVVGRANEPIRAAEVALTGLGNNGVAPEAAAANAAGLFVARPVPVGLVAPASQPMAGQVSIFDRALNRSLASAQPQGRQVGALGPGLAVPGAAQLDIEVRDARTLAPISGALVITHLDQGGVVTLGAFIATDASGLAQLNAPAGETLLTVDAVGYDLLTVHGLASSRASVLLNPTSGANSLTSGAVTSSVSSLANFDLVAADSRLSDGLPRTLSVANCVPTGSSLNCAYGPGAIRVGALGVLSAFAIDPPATAFNFSASSFLRAFALNAPLAAATSTTPVVGAVEIARLLDDPTLDAEERVLAGPAAQLDASGMAGLVLAQLNGEPSISLESASPGVSGPVTVGLGAALDPLGAPATRWEVRSALPGAADPTSGKYSGDEIGALYERGTLVGEVFLRAELRDTLGARSARRTPIAAVGAQIVPPDAPVILSPGLGSTTAGASYDVLFSDCIPSGGDPGLYRVTLAGANGRRWVIWRSDGGGATRSAHVPAIVNAGGVPLPPGAVAVSVRAYAYPSFDPAAFLFSDLELLARAISDSAPVAFSQP